MSVYARIVVYIHFPLIVMRVNTCRVDDTAARTALCEIPPSLLVGLDSPFALTPSKMAQRSSSISSR